MKLSDTAYNEEKTTIMNKAKLNSEAFKCTHENKAIELFSFENLNGVELHVTNYGAKLVSIMTQDKDGKFADLTTGYTTGQAWIDGDPYFGATVGRFANRIGGASFEIDGIRYDLEANNGPNNLHGGPVGFDSKVWDIESKSDDSVTFSYTAADMENGFPGELKVLVTYTLTEDDEVKIDYRATSDKKTVINLTNHTYFNLAGEGSGTIENHHAQIFAKTYTPSDEVSIPYGNIDVVTGTPMDFTKMQRIGEKINEEFDQLKFAGGYDHNYVLDKTAPNALDLCAKVIEPNTGRVMEMFTTEPGMQFYTGNFLDGSIGKSGKPTEARGAFAMEAQNFPDAPNKPHFPSSILSPGETYTQTTIYKFSIEA